MLLRRANRAGISIAMLAVVLGLGPAAAPAAAVSRGALADDVADARRAVQREQDRFAAASARAESAARRLRAMAALARRRLDRARRREDAATRAGAGAFAMEQKVRERRREATTLMRRAQARAEARTSGWRAERGRWASLAAALLSLAGAAGLLAFVSRQPREPAALGASAIHAAAALGASVTAYLVALIGLLRWADAWRVEWTPAATAVLGVGVLIGATAAGWARVGPARRQLPRAIVAPPLLLLLGVLTPAAVAASSPRPALEPLPVPILLLAQQAEDRAPMPPGVQALRSRADRLAAAATSASDRSAAAALTRDRLAKASTEAKRRLRAARRSLALWSRSLDAAGAAYDRRRKRSLDATARTVYERRREARARRRSAR